MKMIMKMINGRPRRACLTLMTPAELAIRAAIDEVEKAGADVLLTDAVILLGQAREKVADFVDGPEFLRVTGPSKRQYELRHGVLYGNWSPSENPPRADHWFPQTSVLPQDVFAVADMLRAAAAKMLPLP